MAHILIVGASKGIGYQAVKVGLERGHRIRAFARSAGKIDLDDPALEKVAGDATDPASLAPAVEGVDAVIMALGVPPQGMIGRVELFSRATQAVLDAMKAAGVSRLVAVTGFGAGDSRCNVSLLEKIPFELVLGRAYADKTRQEALIRASGLEWTIARPTILTNGKATGRYRVLSDPASWRNGMVSRADVADFLIREVEARAHIHGAPVLAY